LIRIPYLFLLIMGSWTTCLSSTGSNPETSPYPFNLGERLEYEITWGFFPVGSAVMEVLAEDKAIENSPILVRFNVRTNSFADTFYKVRTSITSTVSSDFSRTLKYQKEQREGKTRREIEVVYNYDEGTVSYVKNGSKPKLTQISGYVHDPLSIAYLFRLHPLIPGGKTVLPTCDGKRFQEVVVQTKERKLISLPRGRIFAIETIPALSNLRGVFNRSPQGTLKVWYSDDERRVPLRVSSRVIVGSFTASLIKASPPIRGYH